MKFKLTIDTNQEELTEAIVHSPSELTEQIENLVLSYTGQSRITGFSDDGVAQLEFSEIECITIMERKIIAIDTKGEKYRINRRLCDLENVIPSYFVRINKSALANTNRILRFDTVFSGAVDAVFKCGYREYVSRRCFAEIKRRLDI